MYICKVIYTGGTMRVISGTARGTILHSIEEKITRPTLDRVKESLFNIISKNICEDTIVLDLFAGSGAIGIEFLSRGVSKVTFCDNSSKAVEMIKQNLKKTRFEEKAIILNKDYNIALKKLYGDNKKFNIIYLDPPYKTDYGTNAINIINELNLLEDNGIVILETDEKQRDIDNLNKIDIKYKIYDIRKYGRAYLIFLKYERGNQ